MEHAFRAAGIDCDAWISRWPRPRRGWSHERHQHPQWGDGAAARRCPAGRDRAGWRALRAGAASAGRRRLRGRHPAPIPRLAHARALLRRRPLSRASSRRCSPRPSPSLPRWCRSRNRGDCVLELFHGPTAAFKDFGARFLAACMRRLHPPGRAYPHRPRGHLGRHRRRGGGGLPPHARRPGGAPLPRRPRVAAAGPPAGGLRRERHRAARGRHVRRVPGDGEGGVRRPGARATAAHVRQQHQPRPAPAAARVPRVRRLGLGGNAEPRRAHREPRQRGRRGVGARARRTHRRHRPGDQRQPDAGRVLRGRRVPRAAERADARERDGCG